MPNQDGSNPTSESPSTQIDPVKVNNTAQASVLRNALSMALGTFSSRVLGLLREMLFAALFSRTVTDAWMAAFRLPNLFRRLLGEGSLSVSFIPVFVDAQAENNSRARNLVNGFYTLLLVLLTVLTTLGIVFSDEVLRLILDPEYMSVPGKFEMTVRLAQIMFGFIFLMSSFAFFMGILNALGHFALPAIAPTLFNVAMILGTVLPQGWFAHPGDGLAWSVLLGGFLQMGILIPQLRKRGFFPKLTFDVWSKDIRSVLKNMAPGLVGLGLLQITTVVNMRFATRFGEGALSYITWADRLLELPLSLVSVSLGTALLPTLAKFWTHQEKEKFSETSEHYLILNLVLGCFCSAVLYAFGRPIVEILFERGRFTPEDTIATARVVQIYSLVLIPASCVRVLAPSYYAVKNTWFPAVISFVSLACHLIFAPILMDNFGLTGLNLSSSISAGINALCLVFGFNFLITKFNLIKIFWVLARLGIATIPVFFLAQAYEMVEPQNFVLKVLVLGIFGFFSLGVYLTVSRLLGIGEVWEIIQRFRQRLFRKKKSS